MNDLERRHHLAEIAKQEAERRPAGDVNQAGPEIERYLSLFRETMNRRASTIRYANISVGYDWCCAFVYFCCLEAGFRISPEPSPKVNGSLAAVRTWREWASLPEVGLLLDAAEVPEVGDIVIYDRLLIDIPLDHVGIVVDVGETSIVTAEGNVDNQAGISVRPMDSHINSFIRLRASKL